MVGRPGKFQPRFTAGELDPLLHGNTDEKAYFTGASRMENASPLPQGGFAGRPGTRRRDLVRNVLAPVSTAGATVTGPAGGSIPAALDGDPTTVMQTGPIAGPTLVLRINFAAPVTIGLVDLVRFAFGTAPALTPPVTPILPAYGGAVTVSTSADGATFVQFGNTANITDTFRTRRFALAPGHSVMAQSLILTVAGSSVPFNLGDILIWNETATPSPARVRPFNRSAVDTYDLVFTDRNIEVYSGAGRVASIASPIAAAQVPVVKSVQQLDTMVLFHQLVQPTRILRQGTDFDWNVDAAPFTNIPNFDFGATYSNGVAAVWTIQFFGFDTSAGTGYPPLPSGGASFVINVNGQDSPAIQLTPITGYTALAATLLAAILALPGVAAGVTVVQDLANTHKFAITFAGAGNKGDGWAVSGHCVDKSDAAVTSAHTVVGILGGEPLMSAARGWPACGLIFGQRLLMGGFLSLPGAILASQAGSYFELDTRLIAATAPMLIPLDTEGAETIVDLHLGRTLIAFTDQAEYWLLGGTLSRTAIPVFVEAARNGIATGVRPVENEGRTLYLGPKQGSLYEFSYVISEQNYESINISVAASGRIKGIVDNDLRRATASTDFAELFLVRADGGATKVALLRSEAITAFTRLTTDGQFLAVCVNGRAEVSFVVDRMVGAARQRFLERLEDGLLLDQAEDHVLAPAATLVSGLSLLEGATVWAQADDYMQGPFVVTGGAITLGFAAGHVTVGRWSPPVVMTLPQPNDVAPRTVLTRPARVHTVRAKTVATSSIAIGANAVDRAMAAASGVDPSAEDVPLLRFGQPADTPPLHVPVTADAVREGIRGFSGDAIVTITQLKPGLLACIGVTVEVDQ